MAFAEGKSFSRSKTHIELKDCAADMSSSTVCGTGWAFGTGWVLATWELPIWELATGGGSAIALVVVAGGRAGAPNGWPAGMVAIGRSLEEVGWHGVVYGLGGGWSVVGGGMGG